MSRRPRFADRRGFSTLELVASLTLLAAAAALIAQGAAAVHRETRRAAQFDAARQEADNALERALLRPWEQLADDSLLTEAGRAALPAGRLELDVQTEDDAARVTATVVWQDAAGVERQVALVAWRHRAGPGESGP